MSSFRSSVFREQIRGRLAAAGDELFSVLAETTVRYEAEIERQRRLTDVAWQPEVKLHRLDDQQLQAFKKEAFPAHQHLSNQE